MWINYWLFFYCTSVLWFSSSLCLFFFPWLANVFWPQVSNCLSYRPAFNSTLDLKKSWEDLGVQCVRRWGHVRTLLLGEDRRISAAFTWAQRTVLSARLWLGKTMTLVHVVCWKPHQFNPVQLLLDGFNDTATNTSFLFPAQFYRWQKSTVAIENFSPQISNPKIH